MIIALMALAFAMILGGLLTAFFGWDIVLVERGWTMVIAGSISAASGALLLGITAAVSRLASIQAELARLQEGFDTDALGMARASAPGDLSPAALAGGLLGGLTLGKAGAKGHEDEAEPLLPFEDGDRGEGGKEAEEIEEPSVPIEAAKPAESVIPFPSRPAVESAPSHDEEVSDLKVPEFLLADRRETEVESRISEADESLYEAGPETEEREEERSAGTRRDEDVTPAVWPEAPAEPEPVAEQAAPEAAPEETRSATIIGTYNSGDNKYVMFSDGSIEAQTPRGVFRFKSLDELKEFIASGGESNSSAAI